MVFALFSGFLILGTFMAAPRQTGRWWAKVVIGYRAQMRDEGQS